MKAYSQTGLHLKMRRIRDLSGFSQKDMAEAIGISQSSYHNIEIGKTDIAIKHLEGFTGLLGIFPGDFFAFTSDELASRIKRKPHATPQMRGSSI